MWAGSEMYRMQAEIEAMRPTFEQLQNRYNAHRANFTEELDEYRVPFSPDCGCDGCQMWRDYEARKPK
jgi:hypothetical protein